MSMALAFGDSTAFLLFSIGNLMISAGGCRGNNLRRRWAWGLVRVAGSQLARPVPGSGCRCRTTDVIRLPVRVAVGGAPAHATRGGTNSPALGYIGNSYQTYHKHVPDIHSTSRNLSRTGVCMRSREISLSICIR